MFFWVDGESKKLLSYARIQWMSLFCAGLSAATCQPWLSSLYVVVVTLPSVGRCSRRAFATACRSTASITRQRCFIWTTWSSGKTLEYMSRYRRLITDAGWIVRESELLKTCHAPRGRRAKCNRGHTRYQRWQQRLLVGGMWPFQFMVGSLGFGFRCHFLSLHLHSLWCLTTPPTPLPVFILPSPALSLLPSVVREERAVPEASAAWPAGGAAAEAHSIPSVVAEHGKEVSDGGRDQRPAECCRASGHVYMWADNTTTDSRLLWKRQERWHRLTEPVHWCRVNMWLALFTYCCHAELCPVPSILQWQAIFFSQVCLECR